MTDILLNKKVMKTFPLNLEGDNGATHYTFVFHIALNLSYQKKDNITKCKRYVGKEVVKLSIYSRSMILYFKNLQTPENY